MARLAAPEKKKPFFFFFALSIFFLSIPGPKKTFCTLYRKPRFSAHLCGSVFRAEEKPLPSLFVSAYLFLPRSPPPQTTSYTAPLGAPEDFVVFLRKKHTPFFLILR